MVLKVGEITKATRELRVHRRWNQGLLACLLAWGPVTLCLADSIEVTPHVFEIPLGQLSAGKWPDALENAADIAYHTFRVTFTTAQAISTGGGIQVGFGFSTHLKNTAVNPLYSVNQGYLTAPSKTCSRVPVWSINTVDPGALSYTSVSTTAQGVVLWTSLFNRGADVLVVEVRKGTLQPGDQIEITFGDTSGGSPGMPSNQEPGLVDVLAWADHTASGSYELVDGPFPRLIFTGEQANALMLNGPVTASPGSRFDLAIVALQRAGSHKYDETSVPVYDFTGTVDLQCTDSTATFPAKVTFTPGDLGSVRIPVTFGTPGNHTFTATSGAITSVSNTIMVGDPLDPADLRMGSIACGDLQLHSGQGGHAYGTDWDSYEYLYDYGYTCGAVVQHVSEEYSSFMLNKRQARKFQSHIDPREESFVAFCATEQSFRGNHHHTIYCDLDLPGNPVLYNVAYRGADAVVGRLRGYQDYLNTLATDPFRAIGVLHHSQWGGPNFDYGLTPPVSNTGHSVRPVVEIYSSKGSSENAYEDPNDIPDWEYPLHRSDRAGRPPEVGASAVALLQRGERFGFIASSDRHMSHPQRGIEGNIYNRQGCAMMIGDPRISSLRERIWEAIVSRRTYATTGARIPMGFEVFANSQWHSMGSDVAMPFDQTAVFRIAAVASADLGSPARPTIDAIHILRDGVVIRAIHYPAPQPTEVDFYWKEPPGSGSAFYYVRVIQSDEHVAWASPIWIDRE